MQNMFVYRQYEMNGAFIELNPICPPQIESSDQTSVGVLISLSQRTLGCQPQKLSKVKLEQARSVKKKRGAKMDFISPNLWILISPVEIISKQYNQMKILNDRLLRSLS